MFDLMVIYFEGLDALSATSSLKVRVLFCSRFSAHAAVLFHLESRGSCVYYSVEVGTPARLHLWLISEQFFKLPVKMNMHCLCSESICKTE